MDEDDFRKPFMQKSVFKQASSLDMSYVPDKLYCRDEAINTFIFKFRTLWLTQGTHNGLCKCKILQEIF